MMTGVKMSPVELLVWRVTLRLVRTARHGRLAYFGAYEVHRAQLMGRTWSRASVTASQGGPCSAPRAGRADLG